MAAGPAHKLAGNGCVLAWFAALKDGEGKVISTPEAAAAMWERKFLKAFSGMGELRVVAMQLGRRPGRESRCAF